jgi:hypothetical protein
MKRTAIIGGRERARDAIACERHESRGAFRLKRGIISALVVVGLLATTVFGHQRGVETTRAAGHPDTQIAQWDAVATEASLAVPGFTPLELIQLCAYLGIAIYDSVMAIDGSYEPFMVEQTAPSGASVDAAVAAAARTILLHHLTTPAAMDIIEDNYDAEVNAIPDGQAKNDGLALGASVAQEVLDLRANDGFRAPTPDYVSPDPPVPGVFILLPPPPPPLGPIGRYLPAMTPWVLDSASDMRPNGPPALHTGAYANDYNEVKAYGAANSTVRTPEQTLAALFWGESPVVQARGGLRGFVLERELDTVKAARFLAMASVVSADAMIACFDAKYHYAFWRPITAIRAGDTDGNVRTIGDPNWTPLIPVPNHPEYPSAHSCVTPAAARVIARYLGTSQIDYTIPSLTGLGDRHFPHMRDLIAEVGDARVWGGIHFRDAVRDGTWIATRVTNHILAQHFQPAR